MNLLLGEGNEEVDISGTLDPAPPVRAIGTVEVADGSPWTITRDGFDWKAAGFLVGQTITVTEWLGDPVTGSWVITDITGEGFDVLELDGVAPATGTFSWDIVGTDDPGPRLCARRRFRA